MQGSLGTLGLRYSKHSSAEQIPLATQVQEEAHSPLLLKTGGAQQGWSHFFPATQELTNRISPIVEKLFEGSSFYIMRLKKPEMVEYMVSLFKNFSPEEFKDILDSELRRRILKLLTLEAVAGTLNDLTLDQMSIFDEFVLGE